MKAETRYIADDGTTHATPWEAHKADLRAMLATAAGNDPIARQLTECIAGDVERWRDALVALWDARLDKAAELPLDHTPGGVKHWKGVEPDASPAPATAPWNCQHATKLRGEAYPRTCAICKLGPCPHFSKTQIASDIEAQRATIPVIDRFGERPTKFEVNHPNGGPPPIPASNRSPSDQ